VTGERRSFGTGALLVVVALAWLFPYAWMALTSLKTLDDIVAAPTALVPAEPGLDAYRAVLATLPIGRYFWNTTLMALLIAALQLLLALPAGYALAKLRFRGRAFVFGLVIATLLVPAQVRFVPVFTLFADLGLTNTMAALVLPFGVSALGTFLVRQALSPCPTLSSKPRAPTVRASFASSTAFCRLCSCRRSFPCFFSASSTTGTTTSGPSS
jgi:sn-glycerol 3-phosphate transport system permease protein